MSSKSDDSPPLLPAETATAESVAAYLRAHPDFLAENTDLMTTLTPPQFIRGEGVVDMQSFMLNRLQSEVAQLKSRERNLLAAAESNVNVQSRVHHATGALLNARSFKHLIRVINEELPEMLEVEATALCVETDEKLFGKKDDPGVAVIKPGTIAELFEPETEIVLRPDTPGEAAIFGTAAAQVKSSAMLRLGIGPKVPMALLALGSRAPDGFDPRQGTELLGFFSHVVEHCIRRWLSQPG
ncbi:MAG: DUF484 family protein [Alphaproteobacteria bacterium]